MTRDALEAIFRTVGKWGRRRCRRPFPLPGTPHLSVPMPSCPDLFRARQKKRRGPPARRAIRMKRRGSRARHVEDTIMHHATAIVTGPAVTRSGPPTALPATEGVRDEHRCDMPTHGRRCRPPGAARARSAFADGNVDRPVESAKVDIPARHSRDANVESAAICLPDAHVDGGNGRRGRQADMHPVDKFKPDSSGLVPGVHVLQHGGKGGNRTDRRSGGQHQQGGTGR